jgi:hypothetical protein
MFSHNRCTKLHVVGAQAWRMRPDVKHLDFAVGWNDVEVELALGLRQRLPGLAHVEGLILGVMELELPETTESTSSEFEACARAAKTSPAGTTSSETFLPKALGHRDGLGKEHLLVFAKALLLGAQVFGTPDAHHAHADDHHVPVIGVGSPQNPLQRQRVGHVAHGHHDAAGADLRRLAAHRVLVLELEVVLHLPGGQGMLAQVLRSETLKMMKNAAAKTMPLTVAIDLVNRFTIAVLSRTRKTDNRPIGISMLPMRMLGGTFQPRSPWYFQRSTSIARLLKVNDQMTPKA